ncbi:MAG: tetratricopeptide repeat protein, partial [Pyrinomonadaceae bacterium]|nr:tetratricopeptide repeat protein [Pyrinomonadaceae bacterium]
MKTYQRFFVASVVLLCGVLAATLPGRTQSNHQAGSSSKALNDSASPVAAREDAYRQNNLGVALLEQFKYKEATEAFRRALQLDPKLSAARINLAIALYNIPEIDAALREAKATAEQQPGAPQPHYILGLIAKAQNRTDEAVAAFERVLKIDARDTGANINAGQLFAQQRRYPEAVAAYRIALDVEPYNMTAVYSLAQAYLRSNQRAEGQRLLQRFQELRASGSGTSIGQNYLEQGRYAEAVISTGAEPELVNNRLPNATFADATADMLPPASNAKSPASVMNRRYKAADFTEEAKRELVASLGGGITLFDYDGDKDLDLFEVGVSTQRLLRNDGGKFVETTAQSGDLNVGGNAGAKGTGISAVAGDYDNDNKPDLFVLRHGANTLYHNDGNGRFSDV